MHLPLSIASDMKTLSNLKSEEARAKWENSFDEAYIQPILKVGIHNYMHKSVNRINGCVIKFTYCSSEIRLPCSRSHPTTVERQNRRLAFVTQF